MRNRQTATFEQATSRVARYPAKERGYWCAHHRLLLTIATLGCLLLLLIGLYGYFHARKQSRRQGEQSALLAQKPANLKKTVTAGSERYRQIDQQLKEAHFNGTALLVKNGQIVLHQGYGFANSAKEWDNGPQTVFHLASVGKELTAVLVAQEVAAKKLSYDDRLDRFYPNVPAANQITVRDLLTMTSGLKQALQPSSFESEQDNVQFSADHASLENQPGQGSGWTYQPVNYRLLAGILMQVSGKSYRQLVQDQLLKPYQLDFDDYEAFHQDNKAAKGYREDLQQPVDVSQVEYQRETGTGNYAATSGQLYRFYWLLLHGKIVKQEQTLLAQHLPAHYTAGFYKYGQKLTAHGIFSGYEPSVVLSENGNNAVILLANQYYRGHSFEPLATKLYDQMLAPAAKQSEKHKTDSQPS
ncbi:serine hydrolase [Leuconostocaceae bacterium ESL0958]|nr:serine hydrolase [Leuconostocaceae bacterium ESL0958]